MCGSDATESRWSPDPPPPNNLRAVSTLIRGESGFPHPEQVFRDDELGRRQRDGRSGVARDSPFHPTTPKLFRCVPDSNRTDLEGVAGIMLFAVFHGSLPAPLVHGHRPVPLRPPPGQPFAANEHPQGSPRRDRCNTLDDPCFVDRRAPFRGVYADLGGRAEASDLSPAFLTGECPPSRGWKQGLQLLFPGVAIKRPAVRALLPPAISLGTEGRRVGDGTAGRITLRDVSELTAHLCIKRLIIAIWPACQAKFVATTAHSSRTESCPKCLSTSVLSKSFSPLAAKRVFVSPRTS